MRRRPVQRIARERGAVMMELLVVAPLLITLAFGMVEAGLAWRGDMAVSSAARAGARVASNLGEHRMADYETLIAVQSALDSIDVDEVVGVLIYDASAVDGSVPAGCGANESNYSHGSYGRCNYYTGEQLAAVVSGDTTNFAGTDECEDGSWDENWCPVDRQTRQSLGLDQIGVQVEVKHSLVTGVFPMSDLNVVESAVMQAEPR